jgi:hypothetical protein
MMCENGIEICNIKRLVLTKSNFNRTLNGELSNGTPD